MVCIAMAVTIKLKHGLDGHHEQWLAKNIGPRLHYIHNSIGGQGWLAKKETYSRYSEPSTWTLTFEDERYATFFIIMFPQ
jgi:hypothetical protein